MVYDLGLVEPMQQVHYIVCLFIQCTCKIHVHVVSNPVTRSVYKHEDSVWFGQIK